MRGRPFSTIFIGTLFHSFLICSYPGSCHTVVRGAPRVDPANDATIDLMIGEYIEA